jgi:outer membrane protein assembly factor BamA
MKKSFTILCLLMWVLSAQAQIRLGQSRYTPAKPVDILELNYSKPQKYKIAEIKAVGLTTLDEIAIVSLSGLRVDDVISVPGDAISTALKRIWGQGIIGDVKILVTKIEGDDIYLLMELTERPRFSKVEFTGVKFYFEVKITGATERKSKNKKQEETTHKCARYIFCERQWCSKRKKHCSSGRHHDDRRNACRS